MKPNVRHFPRHCSRVRYRRPIVRGRSPICWGFRLEGLTSSSPHGHPSWASSRCPASSTSSEAAIAIRLVHGCRAMAVSKPAVPQFSDPCRDRADRTLGHRKSLRWREDVAPSGLSCAIRAAGWHLVWGLAATQWTLISCRTPSSCTHVSSSIKRPAPTAPVLMARS